MQSDTSEPRLVPVRKLDQATGVVSHAYYWDGQLARKVEISGRLVEQLNGYTLMKKDLDSALTWIRRAEQLATEVRGVDESQYTHINDREIGYSVKAFFVASLTFYGKCFTEAAGRRAQASRDWLDQKYRDAHDHFMNYRHNFAAHSGDEGMEYAKTYVLIHPSARMLLPYLPTARLQPDVALPGVGDIGLAELIENLSVKVVERYDKLVFKIISEHVLPRGPQFWIAATKTNERVILEPTKKARG